MTDLRTVNLRDAVAVLRDMQPPIRVPDLTQALQRWLDEPEIPGEALQAIYGPQNGAGFFRSGYNAKTLEHLMREAGFVDVVVTVDGPDLVATGKTA